MDQLEEIRRKIDISQFINQYVPLKKAGRNFKGLCPFHSEKTPSFIVSPERQIWHCFGACNTGGDIFGFLMKMEGLEFGEAFRVLAKRAGVKLISYKPTEEEKQKQLLFEINHLASEYYHYLLLNHPVGKKAREYILGRGISKDSLERFKIGFAPNMWEGLQKFLVGKKDYRQEDLEKVGLVIRSEGGRFYDRFRARIMFPLKDHQGNIRGFAGRVLEKDTQEAKYVNSPETILYHKSDLLYGLAETKEEIKKAGAVVLVEGELDAISSYQTGVKNVVAIKGSAITLNQIKLLDRFTKTIIFALDSDIAGDQAAKRGIEIADNAGMMIKVVEVKGGKDPDEVAQKNPSFWQKQVKEAVSVYDYFLDSAFARFDSKTGEGKRKISQELIPILAKAADSIVQSHYLKLLADRLEVDEESVKAEINKQEVIEKSIGMPTIIKAGPSETKKTRREILEEHLFGLCFQSGSWVFLRKRKVTSLVKTLRFVNILEILAKYLKRYKTNESERLAKMLPAELRDTFNRFYLLDLTDLTQDEDKFEVEYQNTLYQLGKLDLKEQLTRISAEIKALEKKQQLTKSDQEKINKLNQEFCQFSSKITEIERGKE